MTGVVRWVVQKNRDIGLLCHASHTNSEELHRAGSRFMVICHDGRWVRWVVLKNREIGLLCHASHTSSEELHRAGTVLLHGD